MTDTCRTCQFLDVKPRKDGKIVPLSRHTYRCTVPVPPPPPMPKSVRIGIGTFSASRGYMAPYDGAGCTFYQRRAKK
jgi:hypothetical protein